MLRKLKLYGELAEFVGHKEFEIQVDSLAKAVSFLVNNFPQVEKYMNPQYYQVKVGNYEVDEEEIHHPIGQEDIHIVPVISGAGSGTGKILLGAAFNCRCIFFTRLGAGLFLLNLWSRNTQQDCRWWILTKSTGLCWCCFSFMGVSEMLFPLPKPKEFKSEQDPQLSFSFSGTQNTSRAGTPVPIVYGEIVTGSVVISGAIDTQQVQA